MKKQEVVDKLARQHVTRRPVNAEAFDAFVRHMRGYQYGHAETASAYDFFVAGWFAKAGRSLK